MSFFDYHSKSFPLTSVSDYRLLAKKRLPSYLFDFIDGGAFSESTKKANGEDFQRIEFRKRVLKDVSNLDTSIEIFGQKLNQPLILAPVGFAGVYARRGEVQAARAAEKSGIPFSHSTVSICSMEEVQKSTSVPFWYQFYMLKDKTLCADLLRRAEEAGCSVLLLTVDLPIVGIRHRYNHSLANRNFFKEVFSSFKWFVDVQLYGKPLILADMKKYIPQLNDLSSMRKWVSEQLNPSLSWEDLAWIRSRWSGRIVLKGIMDVEDAELAVKSGMDGLVVSNHGARHLDSIPSTISILPKIADAVGQEITIIIDGGIENGLDMIKALALGAHACMIGRAWAFALAARGEKGVNEILNLLHSELKTGMSQLGVKSIREIDRRILTGYHKLTMIR